MVLTLNSYSEITRYKLQSLYSVSWPADLRVAKQKVSLLEPDQDKAAKEHIPRGQTLPFKLCPPDLYHPKLSEANSGFIVDLRTHIHKLDGFFLHPLLQSSIFGYALFLSIITDILRYFH